ncbi:MAG: type II methionyl aminopeptidase [Candidatus Helarchaeales archaeon]
MPMDEEIFEKYARAGKIVARILNEARSLLEPGKKLIDICNFVENGIRKEGADPSFPLNIGINEIAAHYTSPPGDESTIPEHCIIKLDCGAAIDGYTTDMAISVAIGTEEFDYLIQAARAGLERAISIVKPGVKISDVGAAIQEEIRSQGARVISNLTGHQMKQFNLHSGVSVPNVKTSSMNSYKFKEGDVFAIEPFTTNGIGYVKNGPVSYIYSLVKKSPKNLPKHLQLEIQRIWKERRGLPFSLRWYDRISPVDQKRLTARGIMRGYPVLIESKKGVVAQAEHTVIVTPDGCEVVTKL